MFGSPVVPTAAFFLGKALEAAGHGNDDDATSLRAAFILETSLVDHAMLRFKAPMAAASAVLLALHWDRLATTGRRSEATGRHKDLESPGGEALCDTRDCWPARCSEVTGLAMADLTACATAMLAQVTPLYVHCPGRPSDSSFTFPCPALAVSRGYR
jgi:hypothetical protein